MMSLNSCLPEKLTLLRDIYPYGVIVESIFVRIEPTEGRIALRPRRVLICVHRSIVLVAKSKA